MIPGKRLIPSLRDADAICKTLLILLWCTLLLFIVLGLVLSVQTKLNMVPKPPSGIASSIPSKLFEDMLAMEIPNLEKTDEAPSTFSTKNVSGFLLEFLIQMDPFDSKSLLAATLPGMDLQKPILLYRGDIEPHNDYPTDIPPDPDGFTDEVDAQEPDEKPGPEVPPTDDNGVTEQPSAEAMKNTVFIYHSHNRESWLPELPKVKNPDLATDPKKNVTLLGKQLAELLKEQGIGAVQSSADYYSRYKGDFVYYKSYKYSEKTVREVFSTQPDVKYIFDIHRDSGLRSSTTVKADGRSYAQVYFVVGTENPSWQQNLAFAKTLTDLLNEKVPGISKGAYNKSHKDGDGKYNQHLSPTSSLIEIGGVENNLEESYRTVEVLAEVISELVWESEEAEKVNAALTSAAK